MLARLLCWHSWRGWRYSPRATSERQGVASQSNHCRKCGKRRTRKWKDPIW